MSFFDMMTGPGAWGMWVLYAAVAATWIVVVCLATWARRAGNQPAAESVQLGETALGVLERRYATGEISDAEFRRMKLFLSGSAPAFYPGSEPPLHLVTQSRSAREITDLDWGPHPVA